MQYLFDFNDSNSVYFSNLFSAILTVEVVLDRPVSISANEQVLLAQALRQSGMEIQLLDIDYQGLSIVGDSDGVMMATDYAGIMPSGNRSVEVWLNGAGFLGKERHANIVVIDLKTLGPYAKASGAVVMCEDEKLIEQMSIYASLGITEGPVWNDKVSQPGIDGLMDALTREYWQSSIYIFLEETQQRQKVVNFYRERFASLKLVDLMDTSYPRFFPVRLAPELLCPKEDIYTELHEKGVGVTVPFKPLYRYELFKGEPLRGAEQFYKSALALPVPSDMQDAERIADTFVEVIDKYAYRGCSF